MVIKEIHSHSLKQSNREKTLAETLFLSLSSLEAPFLLESGHGKVSDSNRYSFAGAAPFLTMESEGDKINIYREGKRSTSYGNPFTALHSLLKEFPAEPREDFPFTGGAVGYIGYEAGEHIESMPERKADNFSAPDIHLGFYDTIFIYDHLQSTLFLSSTGYPEKGAKRRERAKERVKQFSDLIYNRKESGPDESRMGKVSSNFDRKAYLNEVEKIKKYIESGDIYQANLSHRFSASFEGTPFSLYRRFTSANPVPFSACLELPGLSIISNSPERFLALRGNRIESRPIKGTISRSADKSEDILRKKALRESEKDRAEHIMIVDLVRNDLGRVCKYGTIKADSLMDIESYANLHHMVSTVSGEINEGIGPVDCIKAAFPGGSITGAPKVRAMEIIHEIEQCPRWIYTGSIGYIGFDGSMDLNIAIRTAFIKEGKVYFSTGGGIVADSIPESEYEETLLKGEIFKNIASGFKEK
ncbi:MAG: aminodeoxychorismate synthase component I [Deltaproteobacteria bacterium]|nr:aminodeoxychorismate synthase component I [Deltaproteobacteria bacterium]